MKQKPNYIGIDLGGTKIVLEFFDAKMKTLISIKEKTDSKSQTSVLKQVYRLIDGVINKETQAIGIAVPGPVNIEKGTIAKTPHLPFKKNLPLQSLIQKRYKIPVVIDNDINAFLIAESQRPALKKMKNLVGVMIGTGVGGAIMVNGQIVRGKNGYTGEVGHMVIDQHSELGTFEQKTSGIFISKLAKSLGIKKEMTPYDLDKSTPESKKIKKALVENTGLALANLNLIFNPEAFVLGGSMYHLFLANHKKELEKIIKNRSLDGHCPKLIDGQKKTSVAKGVAIKSKNMLN